MPFPLANISVPNMFGEHRNRFHISCQQRLAQQQAAALHLHPLSAQIRRASGQQTTGTTTSPSPLHAIASRPHVGPFDRAQRAAIAHAYAPNQWAHRVLGEPALTQLLEPPALGRPTVKLSADGDRLLTSVALELRLFDAAARAQPYRAMRRWRVTNADAADVSGGDLFVMHVDAVAIGRSGDMAAYAIGGREC